MRRIVSKVNREYLVVRECKRMVESQKKLKKRCFFFKYQHILRAYSDLCPYSDWALIRTWALVRNIFPNLGAYLSPGRLFESWALNR